MTHTHFIGIGGTGLSAIARVLLERGQTVSGSDRQSSPLSQSIEEAGAKVFIGHAAENLGFADVVVRSSAVPDDNVEVAAALEAGIPVLKRIDYFGQFLEGYYTIGIAGSHGKTTTTSMIAWMLSALNIRPGFIVGGTVANLNTNAAAGQSQYFVIEADEYDYMFWGLQPKLAVVTNIEHDHPDCFPTPEIFYQAFQGYADRITPNGILIACLDDPGAANLLEYAKGKGIQTLSYGLSPEADYQAQNLEAVPNAGYRFQAVKNGQPLVEVSLQVPGQHNVSNALSALIVAEELELDLKACAQALQDFRGSGRRFEIMGEAQGVLVVDDYGHHPTEIKATLSAARARYPQKRIWAVWQPHTYSRSLQLLDAFGAAFPDADQVIVTKVYAAREQIPAGFTHQQILDAIQHPAARLSPEMMETADLLLDEVHHLIEKRLRRLQKGRQAE